MVKSVLDCCLGVGKEEGVKGDRELNGTRNFISVPAHSHSPLSVLP